jgi:hypothetical protein
MALTKADMLKFAEYQKLMADAPAATPAPAVQHVTAPPVAVVAAVADASTVPEYLIITISTPEGRVLANLPTGGFKAMGEKGNSGFNLTGKGNIGKRRFQASGNIVVLKDKD